MRIELGVEPLDAGVERGLVAGLVHLLADERLGLLEHLLDAGGMDAAVGDESLQGDAADLAADGVEAGEHDRLGGVVDDQVDAGELLEGADVAALAADDAALHVVAGDVHDRHGRLGGVVGSDALDGDADDVAGLLVGLFASTHLGLTDERDGFALHVVLDAAHELGACLVGGHAGEGLEADALGLDHLLELLLALLDLALRRGELVLALVDRLGATVDGLLALGESLLEGL